MGRIILLGLFLSNFLLGFSQSDCGYYYEYKGKISFINEKEFDSINIRVPKAYYINNKYYDKKRSYFYFEEISLNKGEMDFYGKFSTLGPCKGNQEAFLSKLFIDNIIMYRIIIKNGKFEREIFIDVAEIVFKIKGNEITIEFPEIKI